MHLITHHNHTQRVPRASNGILRPGTKKLYSAPSPSHNLNKLFTPLSHVFTTADCCFKLGTSTPRHSPAKIKSITPLLPNLVSYLTINTHRPLLVSPRSVSSRTTFRSSVTPDFCVSSVPSKDYIASPSTLFVSLAPEGSILRVSDTIPVLTTSSVREPP